jgi:3-deoxy-manno-octulosonate cytidylyltransferase (CMP-KDO synthetase)
VAMADLSAPPANPIVLIPARMAATRLPGKPLREIGGVPMIVQVWRRAMEADIGPVVVTAPDQEIIDAVEAAGGRAVLTGFHHESGSDRIAEALATIDPDRKYDAVINLQGDLPVLDPETVRAPFRLLSNPAVDLATPVAVAAEGERTNPNVVKAVFEPIDARHGRALYFTRTPTPSGDGPLYHHIGLYAYRRTALETFIAAAPSYLEKREKLEQLRALSLGMHVQVAVVDTVPLGVDTQEDLERARAILETS